MTFKERLETGLAAAYPADPSLVARLCDEHLDPSGALLGRIRQRHRRALQEARVEGNQQGSAEPVNAGLRKGAADTLTKAAQIFRENGSQLARKQLLGDSGGGS